LADPQLGGAVKVAATCWPSVPEVTLTHLYSANTGLLLRDYYPASPGGGALPAETVTHGYETGFDLPQGLGSTLAAYGQKVTYDAFFQVTQEEIGNVTSNAYITSTYDPHTGALTDAQTENTVASATPTPFDDTSYTYDAAGNITSEADARTNGTGGTAISETQCYNYDTLDRLTQAWTATDNCAANPSTNNGATVGDAIAGSSYWTTWAYSPLGDRTSQTSHSLAGGQNTVTSYAYGSSQPDTLTSTSTTGASGSSTASYIYDADGNTLSRDLPSGQQALTWTDDGKLASDTSTAGTTSYVYDADGNLLLQKDPGQTTLYLFGGTEQLVLNTATSAITGTRFLALPGGGEVVRTGTGTAYSFELTDQHGTGVLTLNSSCQDPAWRQYDPYGNPRGTPPPAWPDANGFLGKPADPTTGLTILGARFYDPATGRFLSVDPILDTTSPQQLAGYSYAADDPVSSADPTGLLKCEYPGGPCVGQSPAPGSGDGKGSTGSTGSGGSGSSGDQGNGNGLGGGTASNPDPGQNLLPEVDRAAYLEFVATWTDVNPYATGPTLELDSLAIFCNDDPGDCPKGMAGTATWDRDLLAASLMAGMGAVGMIGDDVGLGGRTPDLGGREQPAAEADLAELAAEDAGSGSIAARAVRFTQDSIGQTFKGGKGSVLQLGQDLANGDVSAEDLPPIRLFEQDGKTYSLDNRRLFAGQMANADLPYTAATQAELDAELPWKFTTNNEGTGIMVRGVGYYSWFGQ
jgi:RHS repeat-associated protein